MFLYITHNYPYQICIEKNPAIMPIGIFFLFLGVLRVKMNTSNANVPESIALEHYTSVLLDMLSRNALKIK